MAETAMAGRPMLESRTAQNREFVNRAEEERSRAEFRLQFLQKELVDTRKELDKAKAEILELRRELHSDDNLVQVKSKEIQTQLKENLKRYRETQAVQEEKKIFETLLHQAQEELFNARLDAEKTVHGLKQAKQAVDDRNQQLLTRNVEVKAELEKKAAETAALTRALQTTSETIEELSRLLEVEKRAREEAESLNSMRGQVHDEMLGMFDPFAQEKSGDGLAVQVASEVTAYHSLDSELLGLCDDFEGLPPARDFTPEWNGNNDDHDETNDGSDDKVDDEEGLLNEQLAAEALQLAAEVERLNAERLAIEEEQRRLQEQRAAIEAEVERLIAQRLATESEQRRLEEQRLAIEADVDRLTMQRLNIEAARCEDEERLKAHRLELQAEIAATAAKCEAAKEARRKREAQLAADALEAERVAQELEQIKRLRIATETASAAEEMLRAEAAAKMEEERARCLRQMQEEQAEFDRARTALQDQLGREKAQLSADSEKLEHIKAQRRAAEKARNAEKQRLQKELDLTRELAAQRAALITATATEEAQATMTATETQAPVAAVVVLEEVLAVEEELSSCSSSSFSVDLLPPVSPAPPTVEMAIDQIGGALSLAVAYLEHRKRALHHRKKSLVVPPLFISLDALIEWLR